ncbi:STAS domain-containing protein [Kitasatospora sp. NPDC059146]|uniref:STAS domain-containing protein n=1 Tax=unclassified Kitasatospora TaxID=2633591 RepID=UPI0036CAE64B
MPAFTLTIVVSTHPAGAAVVVLAGELDYHTAPRLHRALEGVPTGVPVVLDISGLEFCDSIGVSELVLASRRPRPPGTRLPLVGTPAHLRMLFTLTGVDGLVTHHQRVEAAVAALTGARPAPPGEDPRSPGGADDVGR